MFTFPTSGPLDRLKVNPLMYTFWNNLGGTSRSILSVNIPLNINVDTDLFITLRGFYFIRYQKGYSYLSFGGTDDIFRLPMEDWISEFCSFFFTFTNGCPGCILHLLRKIRESTRLTSIDGSMSLS